MCCSPSKILIVGEMAFRLVMSVHFILSIVRSYDICALHAAQAIRSAC